ncbi:GNAT family N-acetyltransferase [Erysipelothrix aquatica]|uniref:GNAT family N-acetyltransferase n=1 Tax=Erysipelothrix aquatica TaxID=2683714 RepID=UPI0013573AEB|nr:GNAT family N-acetyltransferase [Erysipelothrix aquatica]
MKTIIQNVRSMPEWNALKTIRKEVFVLEQGLDECVIEDIHDETCIHILYEDAGKVVASCRVRQEGDVAYIERVSVAKDYRNQSLGKQLIQEAVKFIQSSSALLISIFAQTQVSPMYEKHGFEVSGNNFQIYGTSHIKMIKHIV